MQIPEEIIERLKMFCEENNLGMVQIGSYTKGIHILMIGSVDYSPDQAAILSAAMLLEGVCTGSFMDGNDITKLAQEQKDIKLN